MFPLSPDETILADRSRFTVPLRAMDVIDFRAVVGDAKADGIERPWIEFMTVEAAPDEVLVTCRLDIALRLLCAWTAFVDESSDVGSAAQLASVRIASGAAFMAYVCAAYEQARGARRP